MFTTRTKAFMCGFILSVLFSFLNFSGKCEGISDKILRLHIIANSNTCEDQTLKLKVRDRILNDFGNKLNEAKNLSAASSITLENMQEIIDIAQDEINKNGFDYHVDAKIVNMHFNTRRYGNITLPAGNYNALRVTIGQAGGENWWCVMFPPLCLPAAYGSSCLEDVLSISQCELVNSAPEYALEFKVVEIFTEVSEFIRKNIYCPVVNYFSNTENFEYQSDWKLKI